jgi:zinc protease
LVILMSVALSAPAAANASLADAVERWVHPSGIVVFLVERHDFPYLTFDVSLRTGSLADPAGKEGLAGLTAEWMRRGAGGRTRADLDIALDRLGADIEADVSQGWLTWQGDGLSRSWPEIRAILLDVVSRPDFPKAELGKLKRELEADILRTQDHDRSLNRRFYDRYLFGAHPYGLPPSGTRRGIAAVKDSDGKKFHDEYVRAGNLIVGFSGDIDRAQVNAFVDELAARVPAGTPKAIEVPLPTPPRGRQVLLVDKPERAQNQILVGHLGIPTGSPDIYALDVVNTVFGGTFTARLNQEIRDDRGLSYAAYSYIEADRHVGTFTAWTFPEKANAVKTLDLLVELLAKLDAAPLTAPEVEFAKKYLVESFAFRIDTPDDLLTEAMRAELNGLPPDFLARWPERIAAVTLADANRVREAHIDADNLLISMLCSAASFEEPLKAIPGVTTVTVVAHDTPF